MCIVYKLKLTLKSANNFQFKNILALYLSRNDAADMQHQPVYVHNIERLLQPITCRTTTVIKLYCSK